MVIVSKLNRGNADNPYCLSALYVFPDSSGKTSRAGPVASGFTRYLPLQPEIRDKKEEEGRGWRCGSVSERLPSMCTVPGSGPSAAENNDDPEKTAPLSPLWTSEHPTRV